MSVHPAILKLLNVDEADLSSIGGGCSDAAASKITTKDGTYFMKTGHALAAATMFEGEYASLEALSVVPGLAPRAIGHGKAGEKSYLVTEFIEMSRSSKKTLAKKLAQLHTTPAPIPEGYTTPQFGFSVTTCCGNTPQKNDFRESWADFYENNRIRFIASRCRKDGEFDSLIERTCSEVIPRLLSIKIKPVVVHGDLWSGNVGYGKLPGMKEPESVTFDASACYAHSEYELGIMKMFGGFDASFMKEYHEICPRTEPVNEYEDRVALYELYHHLNHYAMFGGSYRSGATSIMKSLLKKYGSDAGNL